MLLFIVACGQHFDSIGLSETVNTKKPINHCKTLFLEASSAIENMLQGKPWNSLVIRDALQALAGINVASEYDFCASMSRDESLLFLRTFRFLNKNCDGWGSIFREYRAEVRNLEKVSLCRASSEEAMNASLFCETLGHYAQ